MLSVLVRPIGLVLSEALNDAMFEFDYHHSPGNTQSIILLSKNTDTCCAVSHQNDMVLKGWNAYKALFQSQKKTPSPSLPSTKGHQ